MGNGMDKIIDGIYVGIIRDSCDKEQIAKFNITHILSIHEDPKNEGIEGIEYLRFKASDNASQDIITFFAESIDFIHRSRLKGGNVLVHCLAGISRSTTLVIAYIMTVVQIPWYDALNAVRGARKGANPNFGFQRQLQNYEYSTIKSVRENLFKIYGPYDQTQDYIQCQAMLEIYKQNQQAAEEAAKAKSAINAIPVKTYPLAFNAYNLDNNYASTSAIINPNIVNNTGAVTASSNTTPANITTITATSNSTDSMQSHEDKTEFIKKLFD